MDIGGHLQRAECLAVCFAAFLLLGARAHGAVVVNCGFEDADAADGVFDHFNDDPDWTETDTSGSVWMGHSAYVNAYALQAHTGSQKAGLNAVGDTLEVDPSGSGGVGTVSFYYRASSATSSWTVTLQVNPGAGWTNAQSFTTSDVVYRTTTVTVNQTGDVKIRWNMTRRGPTGSFYLDDVVITDFALPAVMLVTRASANPTTPGATVKYTATFSEEVSSVDAADFHVAQVSGSFLTPPSIVGVTTGVTAAIYIVAVDVGFVNAGDGTIRLDVVDDDSIVDAQGRSLGGPGAGNGDFTKGETYKIDITAPAIASVSPARGASVSSLPCVTITFDEEVTGVVPGDMTVQDANGTTPSMKVSTTDNVVWTFSVPNPSDGAITIRLDSGAIKDLVGHPLPHGDSWTYQKDSGHPASSVDAWRLYGGSTFGVRGFSP